MGTALAFMTVTWVIYSILMLIWIYEDKKYQAIVVFNIYF